MKAVDDSLDALQKNGNYFYDKKISIWKKMLLIIDLVIFSVIYITLAFLFSWILDKYTIPELDRNRSDIIIVCEIIGELILVLLALYIIIIVLTKYIPTIYTNPPEEHQAFKSYILTILIVFGIFSGDYKFRDKITYIFDRKEDDVKAGLDKVYRCLNDGDLAPCTA